MARLRLLAIMAHPDDESFGIGGTLARYARQDVDVHACIVTDGAAGTHDTQPGSGDIVLPLKQLRRQELECACRLLGVRLHALGYRDSGMAGAADNQHPDSLCQADLEMVAQNLVRIINAVLPHVVITHDPTGGYFHPDHMKVSRAVMRAWDLSGVDQQGREARSSVWQPERLYFTVIPRSALRWFVLMLRLARKDPRSFGQNRDIDLTQAGVPDDEIHVRLDIEHDILVKEQASACHKSQGGGSALRMLPTFMRRRLMRYEYFVQAQPPIARRHADLFEGLGSVS